MKLFLLAIALSVGATWALPASFQKFQTKTLLCDSCHKLIGQYLNNATLNQMLQQAEHDFCDNVPADSQPQCISSIDEYGQQMIAYVLQNVNSDTLCASLNLCPSGQRVAPFARFGTNNKDDVPTTVAPAKPTENALACTACIAAVNSLKTFLDDPAFQATLKQALATAACGSLPPNMQAACGGLVDVIFPPLIKALTDKVTVDQLCFSVGTPPCWTTPAPAKRL